MVVFMLIHEHFTENKKKKSISSISFSSSVTFLQRDILQVPASQMKKAYLKDVSQQFVRLQTLKTSVTNSPL